MSAGLVSATTQQHSASVTIPATAGGNCVVVAVACWGSSGYPTAMTLGGAAGNFAEILRATDSTNVAQASIWADPDCAGGQTAVAITMSGNASAGFGVISVFEVSGLAGTIAALTDKTAGTGSSSSAYDSGTTAATSQAGEFWAGVVNSENALSTVPGSPWTTVEDSGSCGAVGYQVRSATGTAGFAGSVASGRWAAVVAALQPAGGTPFTATPASADGTGAAAGAAGAAGQATAALYAGSATGISGSWSNTAGAAGSGQGTYATWTDSGTGTSAVLELAGFGAQAPVPAGSSITQVNCVVRHGEAPASAVASVTAQAYSGSTPVGSPQPLTAADAVHEDPVTFTGLAYADLADLRVRVTVTRN